MSGMEPSIVGNRSIKVKNIVSVIIIIFCIAFMVLWVLEKQSRLKWEIGDNVQMAEIFCKKGYDEYRGTRQIIALKYTEKEIYACFSDGKEINVKCLVSGK